MFYTGAETASGEVEIRDNVPTMKGMGTAVEGKYAPMLVPWTILAPAVDRENPDTGDIETLEPAGSGEDFNYVAFAQEDFENRYYRTGPAHRKSWIRRPGRTSSTTAPFSRFTLPSGTWRRPARTPWAEPGRCSLVRRWTLPGSR